MWLDDLAAQLRQGLDGVRQELEAGEFANGQLARPALAPFTLQTLIEFGRWSTVKIADQDAVWLAVVDCCRRREARLWTPVLLQMLAPAIVNEGYRLALGALRVDPAEIRQQLLVEVLTVAAWLPLKAGSRRVRAQLVTTAGRRVEDWLRETTEFQPLSLDRWRARRVVTGAANAEEARWRLSDLRASRPAPTDMELVARVGVLGEDPLEVAQSLGLSLPTVMARLRRARRRLRRLLAA